MERTPVDASTPSVSVILPTYNEATNVVPLIGEILELAPADAEVILVDDDSPDQTAMVAQTAFVGEPRVRVIVRTEDRGFAKAIRAGIEAARAEKVIIMDSDFNHDPREIPRLIVVSSVADLVSGSRFAPGGNMASRSRYLLSLVYNFGLRLLLRTQVQDNLCGYFIMRRDALLALPLEHIFFGFGDYYFRLLHFAQRREYRIIEIPIIVRPRKRGVAKNRVVRTFMQYTKELVRFRLSKYW